ncbi:hypothetical protein C8J57DRAFT_1510869 [Mycena rebaudengoi]|nr:hypothetical protein C8J57DRAFT_1510869 [Mycena rebaudengoi]
MPMLALEPSRPAQSTLHPAGTGLRNNLQAACASRTPTTLQSDRPLASRERRSRVRRIASDVLFITTLKIHQSLANCVRARIHVKLFGFTLHTAFERRQCAIHACHALQAQSHSKLAQRQPLLHSIRVTSLTNPHDDLPGDMKMLAQLIIDDNFFLKTMPVASEYDEMSWKLGLGCTM